MIILDKIEQGSEEWFSEKLGKPSASNASKIVQANGKPSKQQEAYAYELVAERITGKRYEAYMNGAMQEGVEREAESRKLYELTHDVEVKQVGVVYQDERKLWLCSPDGIINDEYGLELKNVLPKTQVKRLLDNCLPPEYFGQIQMSLLITGFKYWVFQSYSPGLKTLEVRVSPDTKYINALQGQLEAFSKLLGEITKKVS